MWVEKGVGVLVLVYIDDLAIMAADVHSMEWFKTELGKAFQITDLGKLKHILGMRVQHGGASRMI